MHHLSSFNRVTSIGTRCSFLTVEVIYVLAVKPSMPETTALGAAMAAGAAEGVSVWSLSPEDLSAVTSEKFEPQINPDGTVSRRRRHPSERVPPQPPLDESCVCVCWQRASSGTPGGRGRFRSP